MSLTTDVAARPRLLALDLARGLAAVVVAFYHFQNFGLLKFNGDSPVLAVPFFFMLSGYVLAYSYGDAIRSGSMGLADFVWVRIARLYPLHIATLLLMALIWHTLGAVPPPVLPAHYPLQPILFDRLNLVEGITLTNALFGGTQGYNTPSWSISVEFWCALILFAIVAAPSPRWQLAIVVLTGIAIALSMRGRLQLISWPPRAYLASTGLFLIGWGLHLADPWLRPRVRMIPPWLIWAGAALAFLLIVAPAWRISGWTPVFYAVFAALIATLAHVDVASPAGRAVMSRAGDWSYGIYLWHFPVICVMVWLDGHLRARFGFGYLGCALTDVAYIVLVCAISAWSYTRLEVPAKHALRGLRARRQTA